MARRKTPDATSSTNSEATPAAVDLPAIAAKPAAEMAFEERVEQTVKWLLTGSRDADVVEAIRAHWPGQELQPLVTAAMQQLIEAGETEASAVRGWCFEATKSLYAQMVAIGDFAGALRAVKQLYELAGK